MGPRIVAILLSAGLAACAAGNREPPPVFVYITNETSGDLTVIDAATDAVAATIPLGRRPRGLAASPDGSLLYVALSGSPVAGPGVDESALPPPDRSADGIGVVDLRERRLVKILPSGPDPEQVAVSRDGSRLYVANEDAARLSVIDPMAAAIVETFDIGEEPEGVAVNPANGHVYVTAEADNAVFVVDPDAHKVVATVPVGARPRSIAFLPREPRAYVTNENGASVSVIDTQRLVVINTVDLKGMRPMGIVPSPDGWRLYVSTGRSRLVLTLEAIGGNRTLGSVDAGVRPWGIAVHPDGSKVYTANGPSHDVSVIDVRTQEVLKRITAGQGPWGALAVTPRR